MSNQLKHRVAQIREIIEATKPGDILNGEMSEHITALAKAAYPAAWAKTYPRGAGSYEPAPELVRHYQQQLAATI
jgi:hypothetical protein